MVNRTIPKSLKSNRFLSFLRRVFCAGPIRKIPRNCITLEIGCGWGWGFTVNKNFFGVEYNQDCVERLQNDGYKVLQADITKKLPFSNSYFDYVFSHDVLEHVDVKDHEMIFKDVYRILKADGFFLNIVPNLKGYKWGLATGTGHVNFVSQEMIIETARRAGFELIKEYPYPLPGLLGKYFKHNKHVVLVRKIGE